MFGKETALKIWAVIVFMTGSFLVRAEIRRADFGKMPDGSPVFLYTIANRNRVEVSIQTYGGIITSIKVPDRHGAMEDVVLGFDSHAGYVENPAPFFGALVGRYANRIGGAHFSLNGVEYKLEKNDGANTLHGGPHGFDKKNWAVRELGDGGLELTYISKDGEAGYPGTLTATVTYHLTDSNEVRIDYLATTDKETVVNLTNHSYFNLKSSGDILGHVLTIHADRFTPVDAGLIPSGELRPVAGTPFDFRKPVKIGARIDADDEQLKLGHGYDHNWVLNGRGLRLAARVQEPATGRILEVLTTQPGVQFYTGNFLDGTIHGKGGKVYARRSGFCLETQHFPDSPNQPTFPSTSLKPGVPFRSTTIFRFSSK
jgi:aldose 1-epimerase